MYLRSANWGWQRGFGAYSAPPANIASVLQNASASSGVPVNILNAVAYEESRYNPNAVSPAGAQGLLQLMPATGSSLGVTDAFDAQQNANAGAQYLAQLYAKYGDWQTALIAYNQGPTSLAKNGPYSSSQSYASDILTNAGVSASSSDIAASAADDSTDSGSPASPFGIDLSTIDFSDPATLAAGTFAVGALLFFLLR
jgi:soluble lytic murein transglycosylase-like protein